MKAKNHKTEVYLTAGLVICGTALIGLSAYRTIQSAVDFEVAILSGYEQKQLILDEAHERIIEAAQTTPELVPTLKHVIADSLQQRRVQESTVVNYLTAMKPGLSPDVHGEALRVTIAKKKEMLVVSKNLELRVKEYKAHLNSSINGKVLKVLGYPRVNLEMIERPLMWPEKISYEKIREYYENN